MGPNKLFVVLWRNGERKLARGLQMPQVPSPTRPFLYLPNRIRALSRVLASHNKNSPFCDPSKATIIYTRWRIINILFACSSIPREIPVRQCSSKFNHTSTIKNCQQPILVTIQRFPPSWQLRVNAGCQSTGLTLLSRDTLPQQNAKHVPW
jgi:hypothetical protein